MHLITEDPSIGLVMPPPPDYPWWVDVLDWITNLIESLI